MRHGRATVQQEDFYLRIVAKAFGPNLELTNGRGDGYHLYTCRIHAIVVGKILLQ